MKGENEDLKYKYDINVNLPIRYRSHEEPRAFNAQVNNLVLATSPPGVVSENTEDTQVAHPKFTLNHSNTEGNVTNI